jgi:hypothetical protein
MVLDLFIEQAVLVFRKCFVPNLGESEPLQPNMGLLLLLLAALPSSPT